MADIGKKEGKTKMQKFEYLENEKSFLDETKKHFSWFLNVYHLVNKIMIKALSTSFKLLIFYFLFIYFLFWAFAKTFSSILRFNGWNNFPQQMWENFANIRLCYASFRSTNSGNYAYYSMHTNKCYYRNRKKKHKIAVGKGKILLVIK